MKFTKYMLIALLILLSAVEAGFAQNTFPNLDDDGISNPNNWQSNKGEWGWHAGQSIGCGSHNGTTYCDADGSMSYAAVYQVDGQSLRMNLVSKGENCSPYCYSNVLFSNRIYYQDGTADPDYYLTLNLYARMTNSASQALEFVLQQSVTDPNNSSDYDPYQFSFQCNYLGTSEDWRTGKKYPGQSLWNVWWGGYYGNGRYGRWTIAVDNNGNVIPCNRYSDFAEYWFYFQRLDSSPCTSKCTRYLSFTIKHPDGTYETHTLGSGMYFSIRPRLQGSPGVNTWMQLDGDAAEDEYSAWGDEWLVCLGTTNDCGG